MRRTMRTRSDQQVMSHYKLHITHITHYKSYTLIHALHTVTIPAACSSLVIPDSSFQSWTRRPVERLSLRPLY